MKHDFALGAETRDLIEGTLLLDANTGQRVMVADLLRQTVRLQAAEQRELAGKGVLLPQHPGDRQPQPRRRLRGVPSEAQREQLPVRQRSSHPRQLHPTRTRCLLRRGSETSSEIEWDPVPALSRTSDFATRSGFVNDKWELNEHWSFNVGVRYDKSFGTEPGREQDGRRQRFQPAPGGYATTVRGDGQHNFSATYGRYVSKVDQGPGRQHRHRAAAMPPTTGITGVRPSTRSERRATSSLSTPEVIRQVFNWFNSVGGTANRNTALLTSAHVPGVTLRFDGPLAAPFMENTLGYGVTFGDGGYLRADYIDRTWGDFYAVRRTCRPARRRTRTAISSTRE